MGYGPFDPHYKARRKCWRKKGWWRTKKAARLRAREIFKNSGIQMYPYRCSECGNVHLTKDPDVKGKGVI